MAKFKIKTGDLVQVISGNKQNKGKQGKVLRVITETSRVVVEGVNVVTKHKRASAQRSRRHRQDRGSHSHLERDARGPGDRQATRVGYRTETVERDGKQKTVRVRVSKSTGKDL